jgi:hypothetical protein
MENSNPVTKDMLKKKRQDLSKLATKLRNDTNNGHRKLDKVHCVICGKTMDKYWFRQHILSKTHKRKCDKAISDVEVSEPSIISVSQTSSEHQNTPI